MKDGDPHHFDDMARNLEIKVQQVTAARTIAEFMRSIEIIGQQYEPKTYITPFDGIVDVQNAQLEVIGTVLRADQVRLNAERETYLRTASIKLVPDHVFGEPMKNPGEERLDPRELTDKRWFDKDWRSIHAHRVQWLELPQLAHQSMVERIKPLILFSEVIFNQ